MRSKVLTIGLLCAFAFGAWPASLAAETMQANASPVPVVIHSEKVDVSPALRTLRNPPLPAKPEEPNYRDLIATRENPPLPRSVGAQDKGNVDPVVQRSLMVPNVMPAPNVTFAGINNANNSLINGFRVIPPDTVGDVGPNHYVQAVNLLFAVYSKTGTLLAGPLKTSALWAGFGGNCETRNDGDPIVLYDELADRWLISQFTANTGTPPTRQCIAISTSGDPTGTYYRYDFAYPNHFNDYPHFGVWGDGYYMTAHNFGYAGGFFGQGVMAFDRAKMLSGSPASLIYFNLGTVDISISGMLPADSDGYAPPPAGTPNYFAYFLADEFLDPADAMRIFQFTANFATPASSTFLEIAGGPIPVAAFNPISPAGRVDIPQPAPATAAHNLDSISDRLMHRLAYRNFGTHESLVVTHSVDVDATAAYQAAPRYYEFRRTLPAGSWAVQEQATFAPDATHRWMGSAAMDNDGNLAVGYSASSSTVFPAIRYAGRLAGDPANQLTQGEAEMQTGAGSQTNTGSRWGDYSSLNLDPADGCTFWYTQEYYTGSNIACGANASNACWSTRIGSFTFPSCTAEEKGALSGNVVDQNGFLVAGALVASSSGLSRTTDAAGNYSMTMAPGSYSVTASKLGYTSATSPTAVTNGGASILNFVLTSVPVLQYDSSTFTDGNGNGSIDPNECLRFTVNVDNVGARAASGTPLYQSPLPATLATSTPGVTVTSPNSTYTTIFPGGTNGNVALFNVLTSPSFVCGTPIDFTLTINTAQGVFVIPFTKSASGAPGSVTSVTSSDVPVPILDFTTSNSTVAVTGVTGVVNTATVSLHLTHTFDADINISLVAPDGTTIIPLASGRGGSGDNFGSACTSNSTQTTFDDAAANSISQGAAPFIGSFRPESPLSALRGQNPNGIWTLRIADGFGVDEGELLCWTLNVQNLVCPDGGPAAPAITGTSAACNGGPIDLTASAGFISYQWYLDGSPITGATSQTYNVAAATSADAGNYTVTGVKATACGNLSSPQSSPFAVTNPSCQLSPTSLATDGNGVMEAAETVVLTPSWTNEGSVTLDVAGTLSNFTGPGLSTYTIIDGAGAYGSVAPGDTAAATDSYSLSVSAPATRPAVHWDATVDETVTTTPVSTNNVHTWTLHIGDSFLDVPQIHPNYRDIETILHAEVTFGCGSGLYCPNGTIPRENMAAFLARALAGGDSNVPETGTVGANPYDCSQPAPTGTSLFTDVAPGTLYCRYIHYIAAANVTLGCGGGQFCPAPNTTRGEMAAFIARSIAGSDAAVPMAYSDPNTNRSYDLNGDSNVHFSDMIGNQFTRYAHYVWARGITDGCGPTTYCPAPAMTRDSMAVFLRRGFNLTLD